MKAYCKTCGKMIVGKMDVYGVLRCKVCGQPAGRPQHMTFVTKTEKQAKGGEHGQDH